MIGAWINTLTRFGGFDQGVHVDIHIVIDAGFLFPRCRPQDPTQILEKTTAESNRGDQKQGLKLRAVETLADKLTRGNQYFDLAVFEPFGQCPALLTGYIPGENFSLNLVAILQQNPKIFAVGFAICEDEADA